ncbi:MAG: cupin domain-containing protein, partial [Bacteroidota bacterium]
LHLGPRLRFLRREQRLSQQAVAERSGLTKGMVSKVETGRSIPTLPALFRLLGALDCPAERFFQDMEVGGTPPPYVHRPAAQAQPLERELAARGFDYSCLLEGEGKDFALRAAILEIEPGSIREKVTTDAYEYKYVLAGELDYEIGEDTLHLGPGDSLFYDGRIAHVPHNRGTEPARLLVVYLHDKLLTD